MKTSGILMVTGAYWPELSGGGLQCRTMIAAMRERFCFRVFTTCTDRALPSEDTVDGIPVKRVLVDVARPSSKLRAAIQTVSFFLRHQRSFDVLHLHGFSQKSVLLVLLARLFRKKVVITIHTAEQDEPDGVRRLGEFAYRCYASADQFIAISPRLAENYRRAGLPIDRLAMVPNAVDTGRFTPAGAEERQQLRAALDASAADLPWLLFVGFFSADKAPEVLADAWLQLHRAGLRTSLLLVGANRSTYHEVDAAIAERIRIKAAAAGAQNLVRFVGEVADVERYHRAADVFVMPSVREAFGMALIEAMASGTPVIATRIDGVTDVIVDDGRTGILVPPRDADRLAAAIRSLLDDPAGAAVMGARARAAVMQQYSLEAGAARWSALYQQVIGQRAL
ncbi:MAG: glycosyltransferase family 4 protein [Vicinamibacterales bacterium]